MKIQDTRVMRLKGICVKALEPTHLEVIDESHLHAGHKGVEQGSETHFYLCVQSPFFAGKTTLAQHRMVMDLFKEEFTHGLHALRLKTGV